MIYDKIRIPIYRENQLVGFGVLFPADTISCRVKVYENMGSNTDTEFILVHDFKCGQYATTEPNEVLEKWFSNYEVYWQILTEFEVVEVLIELMNRYNGTSILINIKVNYE